MRLTLRRANTSPAPGQAGTGGRRARLAARVPALMHDRTFRRYWSGETISMFGD